MIILNVESKSNIEKRILRDKNYNFSFIKKKSSRKRDICLLTAIPNRKVD